MKDIIVKYIDKETMAEESLTIKDVKRISENIMSETLNIDIDDNSLSNKTSDLSKMANGTIVSITIPFDTENKIISDYTVVRPLNRVYYNTETNEENSDILKLTFSK